MKLYKHHRVCNKEKVQSTINEADVNGYSHQHGLKEKHFNRLAHNLHSHLHGIHFTKLDRGDVPIVTRLATKALCLHSETDGVMRLGHCKDDKEKQYKRKDGARTEQPTPVCTTISDKTTDNGADTWASNWCNSENDNTRHKIVNVEQTGNHGWCIGQRTGTKSTGENTECNHGSNVGR